jgi:hypothetical protein
MAALLATLFFISPVCVAKEVIGWVEKVAIYPGALELNAKIDSGAKTSSIHCDCQHFIEKDGEKYVSFVVTNFDDKQIRLERKIERFATIKRHFGEAQERAVIKLGVCVAGTYKEIEVNVIDRSGLNYQMLVGRNFLAGDFLIDTDKTYLTEPRCMVE